MSGHPSAADILTAVSRFLRDELMPVATGREAFNLRVSINAVDLVARQLRQGGLAETTEREGLAALLGGSEAPLETMRDQLARMIGTDDPALDQAALLSHLRRTTIAQLEIDQPGYSALAAARATSAKSQRA